MVTYMREAHAPTGELALMDNFCSLADLEMKTGEALETYMWRVRNVVNQLRGGNVNLHPILVTLFAVRGLDSAYEAAKTNLAVRSENYTDLTLDNLERRCLTFVTVARNFQSDAAIPTAAAAEVANNSTRSRAPGTSTTPNDGSKLPYPPKLYPRHSKLITAQLVKAAKEYPLCFKPHPFIKCGFGLRAGYITKHNPTKAKVKLDGLDLKDGKNHLVAALKETYDIEVDEKG